MSDISIILSHYWCRHSTALCFIVLSCIFNFCQGQRGVHPACLKVRAPCHGNLRVRQRCLETSRPDSIRFVIIEGKTNERPSNGDSQYHNHRHQDSSHMTTSRSAGVHQQVAHSRATTQRRGQRAASRLGADLHAKLLEKLETLYPLLRRVPAEIHPRPSLTISGRRSRRGLVLSSPQTSNPPYQRHRTRCYHIPVSLDLFFYITTSAAKCSSPGQLSRRQHARTRKAPCPLA